MFSRFNRSHFFSPEFDDLFRELGNLSKGMGSPERHSTTVGEHGVLHGDDEMTYQALLPGATREDVSLKVDKGALKVDVTYTVPLMQGGEAYTFSANVLLDERYDTSKIDAKCVNGVLTVKIPFRKTAKIKPVDIKVG